MPYLAEDVIRRDRQKKLVCYGKQGDKVEIVAIHEEVLIVQGPKERFAIKKNKII